MKVSIVGSLRDREVACSASDRQGSSFESCVWRTVSSQSSHHPQEVLLAQFSLYVHKGGLKPDSFHFISLESRTPCLKSITYDTMLERKEHMHGHSAEVVTFLFSVSNGIAYWQQLCHDISRGVVESLNGIFFNLKSS